MKNMIKVLATVTIAASLLVGTYVFTATQTNVETASAASSDYYLKLDGVEGEIAIESFSWGIVTPRDASSGLATGRRQYQPIIIRKSIDKSTPLLFKLANESKSGTLKNVTVGKHTDGGAEYKVVFHDIVISSFIHEGDAGGPQETLNFTYQKIEMK